MLKKLVFFAIFVLLAGTAFANITVLKPVEKELPNNGSIELGEISAGQTIEIFLQKKAQKGVLWQDAFIDSASIPFDWKVEKSIEDESIILLVTVSPNAVESIQNLKIVVSNSSFSETFIANLSVKTGLLDVDIKNRTQKISIEKSGAFKLILINKSIAPETVLISSSLPKYWFEPEKISLKPNELKELDLAVFPKSYGGRNFDFYVKPLSTGKAFTFSDMHLEVYPTLKSKFTEPLYGMPVFTISMIPYYLIDSFIAIISTRI